MPEDTGVGVIAQELEQIAPYMIKEWVYDDDDGNIETYLGVDNGAMTYMLINATKEQQGLIERQYSQIKNQQAEINTLISEVEILKKEMAALVNMLTQD